jgi:hypothetical protein
MLSILLVAGESAVRKIVGQKNLFALLKLVLTVLLKHLSLSSPLLSVLCLTSILVWACTRNTEPTTPKRSTKPNSSRICSVRCVSHSLTTPKTRYSQPNQPLFVLLAANVVVCRAFADCVRESRWFEADDFDGAREEVLSECSHESDRFRSVAYVPPSLAPHQLSLALPLCRPNLMSPAPAVHLQVVKPTASLSSITKA